MCDGDDEDVSPAGDFGKFGVGVWTGGDNRSFWQGDVAFRADGD